MAMRSLTLTVTRQALQWNNLLKPVSFVRGLKQITQTETPDGKIVIEGKFVPSDREGKLLRLPEDSACVDGKACYLCRLNLDVKHTDVLILNQFVRTDGRMLPQRVTGLCRRQQRRMSDMLTMAHKAGLMPTVDYKGNKKDPKKRYAWKAWNSYWDETTIRW